MQALRNASFMSQPDVFCLYTLITIGTYLTNSGRFLDAWALFGLTIRLAHLTGLHRNPTHLVPVPPLHGCMLRQTLWWRMLQMDSQYSAVHRRPLGISGIGDCPPFEPLTTNQQVLRLDESSNRLTILARQILISDRLTSDDVIDKFTHQLFSLYATMPEALQFKQSWTRPDTRLPEWPLELKSTSM